MAIELSDYLKANDTMFYHDFDSSYGIGAQLIREADFAPWKDTNPLNELSETRIETLVKMIHDKFSMWQVWTLHRDLFFDTMLRVFNAYRDYYAEKILAYETEINFLDGNKVTTDHDSSVTETPRVEVETDTYDLPRSDSTINRPSSRVVSKPTTGTNVSRDAGQVISKGGNVIRLKKEYLDLLRSVYDEFAEKFRVNFIDMFDYDFKEVNP